MSKLSEIIEEFNKGYEIKVGDYIDFGESTARIYFKDLLNAHLIKRLGSGWYVINEEIDKIPQLKSKELKNLKKFDNIDMVLRAFKIMRLKELTKNNK